MIIYSNAIGFREKVLFSFLLKGVTFNVICPKLRTLFVWGVKAPTNAKIPMLLNTTFSKTATVIRTIEQVDLTPSNKNVH